MEHNSLDKSMDIKKVINEILDLPKRFYSAENNQSIHSLLKDTGYFEAYDSINEDKVKEALEQQPKYIDQWLSWSEDKRGGSGWYFIKSGGQKYVIGFLNSDTIISEKVEYSDKNSACAAFIKREAESIRIS